jgi:hypothetical protein
MQFFVIGKLYECHFGGKLPQAKQQSAKTYPAALGPKRRDAFGAQS